MNKQKIFDRIAKHLLTQNAKSIYEPADEGKEAVCAYRDYDPKTKKVRKCAVGCLIPFRNYYPEFEGTNIFDYAVMEAIPKSLGIKSEEDLHFLAGLQSIHDSTEPDTWKRRLLEFATDLDLDTSVLS